MPNFDTIICVVTVGVGSILKKKINAFCLCAYTAATC